MKESRTELNRHEDGLLKLPIQFFGDDEVFRGGYNPEEEISQPEIPNPLSEEETPEEQPPVEDNVPEGNPEGEPDETQYLDFGGRKVNPNDPEAVKGAYNDYQNAQRYITQLTQQNEQLMSQMNQFQQMQQQQPQDFNNMQQQAQAEQPQKSPEEINEELMEKFYDNPKGFFDDMQRQAVEQAQNQIKEQYEPMMKEQRIQKEINEVQSKYSDFEQNVPHMQQVIERIGNEEAERIGLENVYLMAKGHSSTQAQPTPDDLLQDESFIEKIMSNESIRNKIIGQYANNKTQQQPPRVMSNQSGSTQPLSSENRPRSVAEASKMAMKYFNS